jgi:hypothetical protein
MTTIFFPSIYLHPETYAGDSFLLDFIYRSIILLVPTITKLPAI